MYSETYRLQAYRYQVRRLARNGDFRARNRERATVISQRKKHVKKSDQSADGRDIRRIQAQNYWIQRSRRLRTSREMSKMLLLQRKMSRQSSINETDVRLLFGKAQRIIRNGERIAKRLHQKLAISADQVLQHFTDDDSLPEDALDKAYGNVRRHTYCSEPYYWEQAYHSLSVIAEVALPIDERGAAHIFKPVAESDDKETKRKCNALRSWNCHSQLCHITSESLDRLLDLLRLVTAVKFHKICDFYMNVDSCGFATISGKLGHLLDCSSAQHCQHSQLNAARVISSHYPQLRSQIRRLYEVRCLAIRISGVRKAMSSGKFQMLRDQCTALKSVIDSLTLTAGKKLDQSDNDDSNAVLTTAGLPVTEEAVMSKHGSALRETCNIRDSYVTRCCDLCEQLREDVRPLKSFEHHKGFDCEKMQHAVELLYQNKTRYEDVEQFLQTTYICKYCADRLRANKDVARSAFNSLTTLPTPDCIGQLNVFEKILIKFVMTSQTIIRLGQMTNSKRPQSELMPALKGRVVHLPVNVAANASFVPEKLFNTDSLTILVGGQPTKRNKIWTSVVDFNKLHAALAWLKTNNHLYKNVPTYSVDDIRHIVASREDKRETAAVAVNDDDALLQNLDAASKSFLYENFTVQPLNAGYPENVPFDYQMRQVHGQGGDIFDSDLDVKAFPELFPTGEFGIRDVKRAAKISSSEFIKSRLLNKDPKFRLSMAYLFFCFEVQEVSKMCHSVGHMLRTVSGKNWTARDLVDRLERRDGDMQDKMFGLMANMRGSKQYFAKLAMNIRWMIKQLGPPTLFITCSSAEWFSHSFIDYLRSVNRCVPTIEQMTRAELCMMDPVNVSIHFHKKWRAIFGKLVTAKESPVFGEVVDYFWRVEYQARGAPHVHCVLWIKDAPVLGKNTEAEVKQYIDCVVTCTRPNGADDPTLADLVERFQVHKCNKYCMKTYKCNGKFYSKCRFGFPRPTKSDIMINDVVDCLAVQKNNQPRKRLYHLRRNADEVRVNDYNPALLLANEANVDVQYIGHLGSRLPYYITDYMTKHERSEQDDMWHDIFTSSKSLGTNAMSYLLKSVKSRQVGACEAADRLLGHKLYSASRQMRFADLQPANKAKRLLKPIEDIKQLIKCSATASEIYQPHWVLDIYPDRPDSLESCSLHEFLAWYEREKSVPGKEYQLPLKTKNFHLRRRIQKHTLSLTK